MRYRAVNRSNTGRVIVFFAWTVFLFCFSCYNQPEEAAYIEKQKKDSLFRKIMPIIGYSEKFNKKTEQAQLRKDVYALAKAYPDQLYINGQTDSLKVSLTFDDGPGPKTTSEILEILNHYDVSATFFCIGNRIKKYPKLAAQIHNEGHCILNHSYTHAKFTEIDSLEITAELQKTNSVIKQVTGSEPHWVRPPYGAIDSFIFQTVMAEDMGVIYWSADTYDWLETGEFVLNMMRDSIRNDEIILLHERPQTVKILPELIEILQQQGYKIIPLYELIGLDSISMVQE